MQKQHLIFESWTWSELEKPNTSFVLILAIMVLKHLTFNVGFAASALVISAMFWATFPPVSQSPRRQRRSEPRAPACSVVLTRAELRNLGNAPGVARKEEKFL